MDNEELISAVFQRRPIWDKRDKSHANRNILQRHWKEISQEMNVDENTAREKCKYLRDQYAVELGKIPSSRSGNGAGSDHVSKWPYFRSLLSLKDIVSARQSSGNLCMIPSSDPMERNISPKSPVESDETSVLASDTASISEQGDSVDIDELAKEDCIETVYDDSSATHSVMSPTISFTPAGKRKRGSTEIFDESILNLEKQKLQYLQAKAARQHDDEDLQFFKSLLPHVRKIPDLRKLSFRSKVQELVEQFAYHQDISSPQHSQLSCHCSPPAGPETTLQVLRSTTPVLYQSQKKLHMILCQQLLTQTSIGINILLCDMAFIGM